MALALGLSLAAIPFLLLWITQLGGALCAATARALFGGFGVIAIAVVGGRLWRRRVSWLGRDITSAVLMTFVLGIGLMARLLAVRDLVLPAWVDSVHHTLLAHIIAESGRIPASYKPYIAVHNATYHYGFHASVALFSWLSDKPLPQTMLFVGQLFNLSAALQVYLLARWLTRRRRAAFFAMLIAALLSTMPAYYVSWGRYTQLTGLLILPVASILSIEAARQQDRRAAALAVLALAGLLLTHYRVFAFYICFVAAWWLIELAQRPHAWRARLGDLGWYLSLGLLASVLLMPWLLNVATELWWPALVYWDNQPSGANWDFSWRYVSRGFDCYILMAGLMGTIVGLLQRQRFAGVLLLWVGSMFLITNPSLLGLSGEGLINNVAMFATWFAPLAICSGFLGDEVLRIGFARLKGLWYVLCCLLMVAGLVALSVVGTRRQITVVNPDCVLAIQADLDAVDWIEHHTALRSRFLINAQPWQSSIYAGTDGGYWMTALTQRSTTTPPALYALGTSDDVLRVKDFNRRVEALSTDAAGLWMLLREIGVDYVYVGALGGPLDPDTLCVDPGFQPFYTGTRVHVFQVVAR